MELAVDFSPSLVLHAALLPRFSKKFGVRFCKNGRLFHPWAITIPVVLHLFRFYSKTRLRDCRSNNHPIPWGCMRPGPSVHFLWNQPSGELNTLCLGAISINLSMITLANFPCKWLSGNKEAPWHQKPFVCGILRYMQPFLSKVAESPRWNFGSLTLLSARRHRPNGVHVGGDLFGLTWVAWRFMAAN